MGARCCGIRGPPHSACTRRPSIDWRQQRQACPPLPARLPAACPFCLPNTPGTAVQRSASGPGIEQLATAQSAHCSVAAAAAGDGPLPPCPRGRPDPAPCHRQLRPSRGQPAGAGGASGAVWRRADTGQRAPGICLPADARGGRGGPRGAAGHQPRLIARQRPAGPQVCGAGAGRRGGRPRAAAGGGAQRRAVRHPGAGLPPRLCLAGRGGGAAARGGRAAALAAAGAAQGAALWRRV